jgi:hypothetical protein
VAATIAFGLVGGLSVNLFYALPATILGFFGSTLAVYIFHKDKSRVASEGGVAV